MSEHHVPELFCRFKLPPGWSHLRPDTSAQTGSECHIALRAPDVLDTGLARKALDTVRIDCMPAQLHEPAAAQVAMSESTDKSHYYAGIRKENAEQKLSFVGSFHLDETPFGMPPGLAQSTMRDGIIGALAQQWEFTPATGDAIEKEFSPFKNIDTKLLQQGAAGDADDDDAKAPISKQEMNKKKPNRKFGDFWESRFDFDVCNKNNKEVFRIVQFATALDGCLFLANFALRRLDAAGNACPSFDAVLQQIENVVVPSFQLDTAAFDAASGRRCTPGIATPAFGLRTYFVQDVPCPRRGVGYRVRYPSRFICTLSRSHKWRGVATENNAKLIAGAVNYAPDSDEYRNVRERMLLDQFLLDTDVAMFQSPPTPVNPDGETASIFTGSRSPMQLLPPQAHQVLLRSLSSEDNSENTLLMTAQVPGKNGRPVQICILQIRHPTLPLTLATAPQPIDLCVVPVWQWRRILFAITELPSCDDAALPYKDGPLLVHPRGCVSVHLGAGAPNSGDASAASRRRVFYRTQHRADSKNEAEVQEMTKDRPRMGFEGGFMGRDDIVLHCDPPVSEEDAQQRPAEARPSVTINVAARRDYEGATNFQLVARNDWPKSLPEFRQVMLRELRHVLSNLAPLVGKDPAVVVTDALLQQTVVESRFTLNGREFLVMRNMESADEEDPFGPRSERCTNVFVATYDAQNERYVTFMLSNPGLDKATTDAFIESHKPLFASLSTYADAAAAEAAHGAPLPAGCSPNLRSSDDERDGDKLTRPETAAGFLRLARDLDYIAGYAHEDRVPVRFLAETTPQRGLAFVLDLYLAAYELEPHGNAEVLLETARAVARFCGTGGRDGINPRLAALGGLSAPVCSPLKLTVEAIELLEAKKKDGGAAAAEAKTTQQLALAWAQLASILAPAGRTTAPHDFNRNPLPSAMQATIAGQGDVTRADAARRALALDRQCAEAWAIAGIVALSETDDDCFVDDHQQSIPALDCFINALQATSTPWEQQQAHRGWDLPHVWYGLALVLSSTPVELRVASKASTPVRIDDVLAFQESLQLAEGWPHTLFNIGAALQKGALVFGANSNDLESLMNEADLFVGSILRSLPEDAGDAWISLSTTFKDETETKPVPIINACSKDTERRPIGAAGTQEGSGVPIETCDRIICLQHAIECRKLGAEERAQAFYNLASHIATSTKNKELKVRIGRSEASPDGEEKTPLELLALAVGAHNDLLPAWHAMRGLLHDAGPAATVLTFAGPLNEKQVIAKIGELEMRHK